MTTIDDLPPLLSTDKIFSISDVQNIFWHVLLDEDTSQLVTFATPLDRYRWLRMPFGISPASEEFKSQSDQALEGLR